MPLPIEKGANFDLAGVAVNEMCVRHGLAGRFTGLGKSPVPVVLFNHLSVLFEGMHIY